MFHSESISLVIVLLPFSSPNKTLWTSPPFFASYKPSKKCYREKLPAGLQYNMNFTIFKPPISCFIMLKRWVAIASNLVIWVSECFSCSFFCTSIFSLTASRSITLSRWPPASFLTYFFPPALYVFTLPLWSLFRKAVSPCPERHHIFCQVWEQGPCEACSIS